MIRNEEAFIPPVCPAIESVHPSALTLTSPETRRNGVIVTPDMLRINFIELDPRDKYRDPLDVFFLAANDDCIDITQDRPSSHPGSEEAQNIEWVERLDDSSRTAVALAIGQEYCERIKKCAGAILRSDGTRVCSALDEDALHPIISELRQQS